MSDDLVERQQLEIETLRERVRQLEELLVPTGILLPPEWRLTGKEARLFAHLTTRELATKQSIMTALYHDSIDEDPEMKIVDVFVCKIRKKLSPFGIQIETVWGQGYRLADREAFQPTADSEAAA